MKKLIFSMILFAFGAIFFNGCEKDSNNPPKLPPYESMAIDFSKFSNNSKSTSEIISDTTAVNFFAAGLTIVVWNAILTSTLIVPVAAFYQTLNTEPEYLGNKIWQWELDGTGFANTYHARMTGTIRDEDVKWEMYISKSGIGAHPEFKWFEGTSNLDGNSGQWILYQSYNVQEAVLQIDWSKTGNEVASVKYTYIKVSDNVLEPKQLTNGSFLQYGLTSEVFNAFYNIDYNTRDRVDSANYQVNIEWSTTAFNGRIKARHYFNNTDWHCWDSLGYDTNCN